MQLWSVYIPANEPASLEDIEGGAYFEMEDHAWCPDCEENNIFVKEVDWIRSDTEIKRSPQETRRLKGVS